MFISKDTQALVTEISERLKAKDETLAVSESACGGLIAASLISVPGASQWFVGGTTTYALKSRLSLSGWSEDEIAAYTGPSEDVAKRLTRNLRVELNATYVLAETGWAGPAGPEVGTVYFGVYGPKGVSSTRSVTGKTDRIENMEAFTRMALQFLLDHLVPKE